MTINAESLPVTDDRTEADALDRLTPVTDSVDDAGLDPTYVTKPRDWEANQPDLIDQAIAEASGNAELAVGLRVHIHQGQSTELPVRCNDGIAAAPYRRGNHPVRLGERGRLG